MIWKRVLNVLVWLALLAGAMVAVGLALLFYDSEPGRFSPTGAPSSTTVQTAERHIREMRQEAERVARAAQADLPTSFTFHLRDEDLNVYFAAHPEELRGLHPGLRAMKIQFQAPDSMSLRARGRYRGRDISFQVKGTLELEERQRLRVTVQEAHLGALPLPRRFREKLAEEINRALSNQWKDLPPHVRLESLSVAEGELILQGRTGRDA